LLRAMPAPCAYCSTALLQAWRGVGACLLRAMPAPCMLCVWARVGWGGTALRPAPQAPQRFSCALASPVAASTAGHDAYICEEMSAPQHLQAFLALVVQQLVIDVSTTNVIGRDAEGGCDVWALRALLHRLLWFQWVCVCGWVGGCGGGLTVASACALQAARPGC